jgi:hypothetical protein
MTAQVMDERKRSKASKGLSFAAMGKAVPKNISSIADLSVEMFGLTEDGAFSLCMMCFAK